MTNETHEEVVSENEAAVNFYAEVFILEEDLKKESAVYQLLGQK